MKAEAAVEAVDAILKIMVIVTIITIIIIVIDSSSIHQQLQRENSGDSSIIYQQKQQWKQQQQWKLQQQIFLFLSYFSRIRDPVLNQ